jgi:CBS domain-containing protein
MGLFSGIVRSWRKRKVIKGIVTLKTLTVGDIMSKYVITSKPDEEVIKASTKMIAEDISCIVVVDGDKPIGVLSERDILKRVPLTNKVFALKVKDVMRKPIVTVPPTMGLQEAVGVMTKNSIRRLVVVKDGKLVGLVTQTDFTKALAKSFPSYPVVKEFSVSATMNKEVLMIPSSGKISQARDAMLKHDSGVVIIVDNMKQKTPIGIMTEYDIVMQFYDQQGKLDMKDIKDYMRKYVRAVPQETSIFQTNKLMLEKNMRRALVVDGMKIAGIITQTSICRYVYPHLDDIEKALRDPKVELRKFNMTTTIHGEFRGEHLKVYDID